MLMRNCICTTAIIACLSVGGAAGATTLTTIDTEVDVIPIADSAETQQNAEPSIAFNPNNPSQLISGAFTAIFSPPPANATTPYWISSNGGATWTDFGTLQTLDKSLAWQAGDANPLTATLHGIGGNNNDIQTFGSTNGTSFNNLKNNFPVAGSPRQGLDQPWIRTGPSSVGPNQNVYVAYNNLSNSGIANGKTAAINVSTNDGVTYPTVVSLDPVGGKATCASFSTCAQDGPSVREAINGGTVYAIYTRWDSNASESVGTGIRFNSTEVVAKSVNFGGNFNAGTTVANPITPFTVNQFANTVYSVGNERVGSDNAIAVSRTDANRVVVAYVDSPAVGQMQVVVSESKDGAATWTEKFRTALTNVRSAQPALTILDDGQVVLLYNQYNTQTNQLSQHLVATSDDFATTTDTILATQVNNNPPQTATPYLGDFFDLTSIGDIFYGIFSASNADNGTLASYLLNASLFQRCFTGTPGTASFKLEGITGGVCDPTATIPLFSIDPIFFSGTSVNAPEPGSLLLLGTSLLGLAALRRRRK
jgi:hypothetical protein